MADQSRAPARSLGRTRPWPGSGPSHDTPRSAVRESFLYLVEWIGLLFSRSPAAADPGQRLGIRQFRINSAEVGAQLARVMLHVPHVVQMQFPAAEWEPGESRRASQADGRFSGQNIAHLLPAN